MRVGLRFECQTDKCCGKRAIILHVDSFSILISFAFREHWKVHEGGADVVREFCSPFFHKLKCYGYGIGNDDDNADTLPTIDEQTIVKSRQCWNQCSDSTAR